MLSVRLFFGVVGMLLISDAEEANGVDRLNCAGKYPSVCPYVRLAHKANDRALNLTHHLTKEFSEEHQQDVINTLMEVKDLLRKILEGNTTDLMADLIKVLDSELYARDSIHAFCKDAAKCYIIYMQIGKSMNSLISAMEFARPKKADKIHEKYDLVFGKSGSETGNYDKDITSVVSDVLDMLEPHQAI